jgi:hypothetical protein
MLLHFKKYKAFIFCTECIQTQNIWINCEFFMFSFQPNTLLLPNYVTSGIQLRRNLYIRHISGNVYSNLRDWNSWFFIEVSIWFLSICLQFIYPWLHLTFHT